MCLTSNKFCVTDDNLRSLMDVKQSSLKCGIYVKQHQLCWPNVTLMSQFIWFWLMSKRLAWHIVWMTWAWHQANLLETWPLCQAKPVELAQYNTNGSIHLVLFDVKPMCQRDLLTIVSMTWAWRQANLLETWPLCQGKPVELAQFNTNESTHLVFLDVKPNFQRDLLLTTMTWAWHQKKIF